MRSYAEPIIAHPDRAAHLRPNGPSQSESHQSTSHSESAPVDGPPSAFLWRGRHYAVRSVVATWLDQAPWWRDGQAPVRRCWRVEASAGMASGTSVVDLACDADGVWHLLSVID
ncbi:MAG: DUF6504 family protein [Dermatophilaceae bacterium]